MSCKVIILGTLDDIKSFRPEFYRPKSQESTSTIKAINLDIEFLHFIIHIFFTYITKTYVFYILNSIDCLTCSRHTHNDAI